MTALARFRHRRNPTHDQRARVVPVASLLDRTEALPQVCREAVEDDLTIWENAGVTEATPLGRHREDEACVSCHNVATLRVIYADDTTALSCETCLPPHPVPVDGGVV